MASTRNISQLLGTVSIPRESLKDIGVNQDLSKVDYRVLINLLTTLSGFSRVSRNTPDPENYTHVDIDSVAFLLQVKKKEVKKSIGHLKELGWLEEGSSSTGHGYRFTF